MYDYGYGHYSFGQFAFAYWWLIFPLMWFVFGLMRMWMRYRQHRDTLEVMRSYAAQGRDPSELAKTLQTPEREWSEPKSAPGGEWRGGVILLCISAGFGIASYYEMLPRTGAPFSFVALITGLIGVALVVTSIVTKTFMSGLDKNGK
jgi:hypothetical protein